MAFCDRVGLLAQKKGMSQIFLEGKRVPLTLLSVRDCRIVGVRTLEKNGYDAVEVGLGVKKHPTKPLRGRFSSVGEERVPAKSVEFRLRQADPAVAVGAHLGPDHFKEGQYVDVAGVSLGKGFAGPMKAHNFGGLRASHGVSVSHRSHGSTGHRQEPAKVFKGKKMATHLGSVRVTIQNLQVVYINLQEGLLGVRGAVPGGRNGYIWIRDAVKP